MAYNFFFLPPLFTFTIANPNNWLSFSVLLLVAVTAANLTARVRAQADLAAARASVAGELYQFTGKLAASARLDDILWAAAFQIASMLKTNVVILLPDAAGRLEIRVGYPPEDELDAQDLAAAMWCWEKGKPAGHNAETLPGAKRLFLPMAHGQGLVGVIGLLSPGHARIVVAGRAAAAGLPARPDRARHRALRARPARRRGTGARRGRQAARRDAELAVARPAHAARFDPGRLDVASRGDWALRCGPDSRPARHHPRGGRAHGPLHRQPARHVAPRGRRTRRQAGDRAGPGFGASRAQAPVAAPVGTSRRAGPPRQSAFRRGRSAVFWSRRS